MRTLIVLYAASYGLNFNSDIADKADITFCNVKNFNDVKDKRFDTIIHVGTGAPSLKTRKKYQTLIEE